MKVPRSPSRNKKPEFVCPSDGEVVRFFNHRRWGQLPVVRMPVTTYARVPVKDPETGKQVYRKSSGRETAPRIPVFALAPTINYVERLWLPISSTEAIWQDGFEPSAAELAQRDRRARIEQMRDTLAERLVDSGLSPDEIVDRLASTVTIMRQVREPEPPKVEWEDTGQNAASDLALYEREKAGRRGSNPFPGFKLDQITPGVWAMPDGSTFKGTRKEAAEELKRLKLVHGGTG